MGICFRFYLFIYFILFILFIFQCLTYICDICLFMLSYFDLFTVSKIFIRHKTCGKKKNLKRSFCQDV